MKFGGLKCTACGADLELSVSFDGMSENAVQFRKYNSKWEYVVHLNCTKCSRTYPICRTPNANYSMDKEPITYKISVKEFLEDVNNKHHGKPIIVEPEKEYKALQDTTKTSQKKKAKRTDYWYYEGKTGSKHKMCNEIWDVCIIVQANNEEEARKRYDECVKRHSLIPLDDPEFEDVTSDDYINDWEEIFLPEHLAEMDKHGTMLVYSKVCNY